MGEIKALKKLREYELIVRADGIAAYIPSSRTMTQNIKGGCDER